MQTLTFTQKLLRQRGFLSTLIPLFAIFFGLGSMQNAQAQITDNAVTLNVRGTNSVYNTQSSSTGSNNFYEQNFGTFNTATASDVFQLVGGTVSVQETGGSVYDQGELLFRVFAGDFSSTTTAANPAFTSIDLGAGVLSGGIRTFTISNANRNLIALATGSVTPGTSNRFDVRFRVTDNDAGSSLASTIRRSVFTVSTPVPSTVSFSNEAVIVDQGNGSVTYNGTAFNTTLIDQKPNSTTTPAFDINTGQLILKGGSLTTTETGTFTVNGAFLDYTLYSPAFNTVSNGTLQLTQNGTVSNGVRNFSLTTGTANLITLIANAGAGYTLQVTYHATYQVNGSGVPQRANDNNTYSAMFDVAGTRAPAPTVQANTIFIAPNGGPNVTFYLNSANSPQFAGADLSSPANGGTNYDVNNGRLLLTNTQVTTTGAVNNVVLYYRTRLAGAPGGAYQSITLTQNGGSSSGSGTKTFVLDPGQSLQPNLISTPAVTTAGTYSVDVYYQANGTNNGTPFAILDPPSGAYTANFTVTGVPIAQTIWTGGKNDNWFDTDNWSNGIPTANTNALVRDLGVGNSVPYPNIYAGVPNFSAGGTLIYDNTNSGPAVARNLILGGTSQASRSITRLIAGRLIVYGDFSNAFDSFIQRENTIMEFGGNGTFGNANGNQTISGGTFITALISGTGTKTLTGIMNVTESLSFAGGVLATNINQPLISVVVMADRAPINNQNGAQLNETENSYLFGFVRTTRQSVTVGETRTYGNMGMTITFGGANSPGNVDVTRNTVEAYSPVNGKYGIRRIFGVRPTDQATNTGGLVATVVFNYWDHETVGLNGPNNQTAGTSTIPEANLALFVSTNSGNTFGLLGRDGAVDQVNNAVVKSNVRTFATFTLGDLTNPLPVRLTAFDAKRMGNDALVTWQTATEENSKGYEVQVSTNGTEYRTLKMVPSASANTTTAQSYSYLDTESNKSGKRYYRLHQVDLDGKDAYFAPVLVTFDGKAVASELVAYPNPLKNGDELHLATQISTAGKGQLVVTDMTGRTVSKEAIDLTAGLNDLSVRSFGDLKSGIYMVRMTLPTGETKNLKVVKQ